MKIVTRNHKLEGVIGCIIGIIFIVFNKGMVDIISIIIGLGLSIVYIISATMWFRVYSVDKSRASLFNFIKAIVLAVIGIYVLFFNPNIISTILGVVVLVILLISLFSASNKLQQFQDDLLKYIIAAILILFGFQGIMTIVIYVIGALAIIYGLFKIFFIKNTTIEYPSYHPEEQPKVDVNIIDVDYTEEKDEKK